MSDTNAGDTNVDHYAPRDYLVRHVTRYDSELPREAAYERGRLLPREAPSQRILSAVTRVEPEPDVVAVHADLYGNPSSYLEIRTEHTRLHIEKEFRVHVAWPRPDVEALDRWTVDEAAAWNAAHGDPAETTEFLLPSPLVALHTDVRAYAARHLPGDRPLGAALLGLVHGIYTDFTYRNGVTTVRTTLPELLELRAGVCQDFAHLAIGCLRAAGLPARYVSGYIETQPPPGKPKLQGSDASHAWASVRTPLGTWVDLDPTNDHFADSRYVVTAWGREFGDVSPLRGIVYGEDSPSTLTVGVDVIRLDGDGNPIELPVPRPEPEPGDAPLDVRGGS